MSFKNIIKKHIGGLVWNGVGDELTEIKKETTDLKWARIWDDTCRDIDWIADLPGISPGRWAVGYNYIYVMTRVLNELRPNNILDLGLGISSTLISAYAGYHNEKKDNKCRHIVIEQDPKWVEIYTKAHKMSRNTEIIQRNCIEVEYGGYKTYAYEEFKSAIEGIRFDVISIDGPWGGEHNSRRDIVPLIPTVLNDSFVIVFDDTDRDGEKETIIEITKKLSENNIKYCTAEYLGSTNCTVVVSEDNSYICTL